MTQTNTAPKLETIEEKLARMERENAALRDEIAAKKQAEIDKVGVFALDVTVQRDDATIVGKDGKEYFRKGAKGGSLRIMLGKQNVFCSLAMALAIVEHVGEIKSYVEANKDKITR